MNAPCELGPALTGCRVTLQILPSRAPGYCERTRTHGADIQREGFHRFVLLENPVLAERPRLGVWSLPSPVYQSHEPHNKGTKDRHVSRTAAKPIALRKD